MEHYLRVYIDPPAVLYSIKRLILYQKLFVVHSCNGNSIFSYWVSNSKIRWYLFINRVFVLNEIMIKKHFWCVWAHMANKWWFSSKLQMIRLDVIFKRVVKQWFYVTMRLWMTNCFLIVIYYHAYHTTTHFIYCIIWLRYYHAQDTLLLPMCGFQITANLFNLDHY